MIETGRYALQWRWRIFQREFHLSTISAPPPPHSPFFSSETNSSLDRPIFRRNITIHLGLTGRSIMYRPQCGRCSMVATPFPTTSLQRLTSTNQGNIRNRLKYNRRRCARPKNPHKEPNLHHLLRSRSYLRRNHEYLFSPLPLPSPPH